MTWVIPLSLNIKIDTGDSPPIRQRPCRMPPAHRQEAKHLLKDMLNNNIIQPSSGPWASPVVLVRKKDGSLRFCIDYRKVNAVTRKDAYPLPRVDGTLDTLACCKWFTTLDLLSGYWQVAVDPKDREKTAFTTYDGLFEFKKMPFGLCNAPATFQRLMDLVLAGLQWNNCLIYLDDVLIIGKTFEEHLSNLNLVFNRLREVGLKFKLSKCVKLSRVKLAHSRPLLHLLLSTTIVCKRFVYKVSWLSQTVKIKHMKFFT